MSPFDYLICKHCTTNVDFILSVMHRVINGERKKTIQQVCKIETFFFVNLFILLSLYCISGRCVDTLKLVMNSSDKAKCTTFTPIYHYYSLFVHILLFICIQFSLHWHIQMKFFLLNHWFINSYITIIFQFFFNIPNYRIIIDI